MPGGLWNALRRICQSLNPRISLQTSSAEAGVFQVSEYASKVRSFKNIFIGVALVNPGMAVLVIKGAFLGIRKHGIGLGDFLEFLLGFFFSFRGAPGPDDAA